MDGYLVILRLLHIGAGILWVGTGFFIVAVAAPAAKSMPDGGHRFLGAMLTRSRFAMIMPVLAIVTTLAGLLLYEQVSDRFNADWMQSTFGVVLSIGAVAGLLAFGHGIGLGQVTGRYQKALEEQNAVTGDIPADARGTMDELQRKVFLNANISFGLMVVAVVGMAAARYM